MLIFNYANWSMWSNPQKVTFDPDNKLIWINSGETSIDVQIDLYSNWKEWMLTYDNAKYVAAFYTFGGDPTSATQTAPPYFFLINGWKVKVSNMTVIVQTNLYSDDGLSPFIVENAAVTNRTSDAQVVKSEIENRLSYGDRVYVDLNTSYYGTAYPIGTIAQPVNNMLDGIAIANLYNITKIYLRSNITLTDDYNLIGFDIYGDKNNISVISNITLKILENSRFYDLTVNGNFAGCDTSLYNCTIDSGVYDINGEIMNCEISGNIKVDTEIVISNCYSGRAGTAPGLVLNMNELNSTLVSVRSYSGGVNVLNCNQTNDASTIELIAGKITLDSSCTNGLLDLRGVGYLIDNSSGTTVITIGFVDSFGTYIEENKATTEALAYGGRIYVDQISGSTGTTYPTGTIIQPVKDPTYLSEKLGIKEFWLVSDFIYQPIVYTKDVIYIATHPNIYLTILNGNYVDLSKFVGFYILDAQMTGNFNTFEKCIVLSATNFHGHIYDSEIWGDISVHTHLDLWRCWGDHIGNLSTVTTHTEIGIVNWSGDLSFKSLNVDDEVLLNINSGKITIESGCTNGLIDIRGVGYLINNASSGCTVITDGLVSNTTQILTDIDGNMTIVTGLTLQMSEDVIYMTAQISGMTSGFTDITTSIDAMTVQVTALDEKVSFISGTTYEMNQNVLIMTSGFTEINSGITDMTIAISGMTDSVNALDEKVSFISGTTYEMNQNVLTMTAQVSGITDDISTMTDAINVMGNEINDMFIAVNNLDAQIKRILGLSQENFRIVDQVYAADNTLLSATIKIYSNSSDCDADINPLETYSMTALYDPLGRLTNYKVRLN